MRKISSDDEAKGINLLESIESYRPFNEQEEKDKEVMINFIKTMDNVLTRENRIAHFTASAWVLNKDKSKVLMIYHNIYNSWSWTGGHADGEENLLEVAIREVQEETGVSRVIPITKEIFSIEIVTVDGHIKRGEYVSSHLHVNVTFLLEADDEEKLLVKEDENSGVKWFLLEDAVKASSEPWMRVIYAKLNEKLEMINRG